jgi:hypothetical protein
MGLCVKKNKSQYMGVLGYPVARIKMGLGMSNKVLAKRGRFYFLHMGDTHTGGVGVGLNI